MENNFNKLADIVSNAFRSVYNNIPNFMFNLEYENPYYYTYNYSCKEEKELNIGIDNKMWEWIENNGCMDFIDRNFLYYTVGTRYIFKEKNI